VINGGLGVFVFELLGSSTLAMKYGEARNIMLSMAAHRISFFVVLSIENPSIRILMKGEL